MVTEMFKIPTSEVGVNWQEIPGSKMSLLKDSIRMLKDLVIIRLNYLTGRWTLTNPTELRSAGKLNKKD